MQWRLKRNLSNLDRLARTILGVLLIALVYFKMVTGLWAVGAVVLAVLQFFEAAAGY